MDERDRGVDGVGRCDPEAERDAEREPELVGVEHVRRVGDGDEQRAVGLEADGQRAVAAREVLREQRGRLDLDVGFRELDERELVLLGENARDLRARDVPALDEDLA